MNSIEILTQVLSIQRDAVKAGASAHAYIARTRTALLAETGRRLRQATDTLVLEEPPSAFDPDSHEEMLSASRCRALLLEVIRRAAHDWVLYRSTRRPERAFAQSAYVWLFEEEPGHPDWELRQREGEPLMAFLTICECLDLEPEAVRYRVKRMTVRDIMAAGRPAETRKVKFEGVEDYTTPEEVLSELIALDEAADSYDVHSFAYTG